MSKARSIGEDVAEGGVVVELEPEPGGVDEDEVARQAELEVALDRQERARGGLQVVQRLLHRGVLDRIELEAAERGVDREQERAAALAELALASARGLEFGRARVTGALSRSARLTAFRTTRSLSSRQRCSSSRASGERILPSAMAAQARVSGGSFSLSSPRGSRIAAQRLEPGRAGDGAVGLEERHLLGEVHLLHGLARAPRPPPA